MKRFTVIIICVVLLFSLSSCFGDKVKNQIEPGMSKSEVKDTLGEPDGYKKSGEYISYKYVDKIITHWDAKSTADYSFVFKNDKLIQYGPGEVREKEGSDTLFIVPIQ